MIKVEEPVPEMYLLYFENNVVTSLISYMIC